MTDTRQNFTRRIAEELHLRHNQVEAAVGLLDEGNTIPFIARYRKEMTGELDENQLRDVQERLQFMRNLASRQEEVHRLIDEQGKLTPELTTAIQSAKTLTELDDLYRPYRPKRKTRASVAREKGLEPLTSWLLDHPTGDVLAEAARYINEEKGVTTAEEALQGALDIFAEDVTDHATTRQKVRELTLRKGSIKSVATGKADEETDVYAIYADYEEPLAKVPPHRILAMNRGEREDALRVSIAAPTGEIQQLLERLHMPNKPTAANEHLRAALEDAYKRLLAPSIEREVRGSLTEKAEEQAIKVFAQNLRNLLLQPPVRGKTVMAVDPAYRTGCKVAVVDETGKVLDIAVTYPTPPNNKINEAKKILTNLIEKNNVQVIAIGNGTASRETEAFVAELIGELESPTSGKSPRELAYLIVNEAGASVYSASKLAGEEFPSLDVAERSAISIGRRLQDPLAELVKIDPKSVGVGQYQHDVSQKHLEEQLGAVVESAVNSVGVDLNTASPSLLSYVSGLSATVAKNVVAYREEIGKFTSRKQLGKVPRLGPKTYVQAVGFLRIPDAVYPLDNTPIHPESYEAAEKLLAELGLHVADVTNSAKRDLVQERLQSLNLQQTAESLQVGVPTLKDIVEALQKPGRDPRDELEPPLLRKDVLKMEDLQSGMILKGTVRNVVDFGAFVDIGVKQDGLVHISELADRFVKNPMDVVQVGDIIDVRVLGVDLKKGRVSLSRRNLTPETVSTSL
ncbi:RNA-binding transcriptional accessory protein [Tumebacillus sp. ITR2]|uniref:RNA-binding transcriptional accessory protein n=1 Tax=Tumebacillus amylolyticus TaxID=2801339 RepID=A0ABS1JH05_9BACL|nr:Tex family protein [Tumebacillus amylolyticus]MBL0389344.1 RNA-binding transcriptional accessory protein [Tumebacillus amylolyticus]